MIAIVSNLGRRAISFINEAGAIFIMVGKTARYIPQVWRMRGLIIEQMMEAIRQLSAETTVLLVEQNFLVASQLAESYVIIEEGRSVKSGKMADLVQDQETIHRYLGAA